MATEILLLGYTPDAQLKFSQHKRGWPTQDGNGFHPVCNACDGYGTVYGYSDNVYAFHNDELVLPRPGYVPCKCGGGWADYILTLNVNDVPGVCHFTGKDYGK